MRATALILLLAVSGWADDAFGTWTMNPARSTVAPDPRPKSITIRLEPHAKGEVFTLDRIEADGRATTSSTILYLDEQPREFQDLGCSGTQSSRRVDNQTVEILRKPAASGCGSSGDCPPSPMNWSWRLRGKRPTAAASSVDSCWRNNRERGRHKRSSQKT